MSGLILQNLIQLAIIFVFEVLSVEEYQINLSDSPFPAGVQVSVSVWSDSVFCRKEKAGADEAVGLETVGESVKDDD